MNNQAQKPRDFRQAGGLKLALMPNKQPIDPDDKPTATTETDASA